MPAMADRGLEHAWVRWVALVITVFHHVTSQYYSVKGKSSENTSPGVNGTVSVNGTSSVIDHHSGYPLTSVAYGLIDHHNTSPEALYYVYATIISLCFILLILLLTCATIAGRSIESIVSKKISLVLKGKGEFSAGLVDKTQDAHPHHHSCWRNVKIDVKRADHHYHLHSSLREVEEALLRADENDHHSCWSERKTKRRFITPAGGQLKRLNGTGQTPTQWAHHHSPKKDNSSRI